MIIVRTIYNEIISVCPIVPPETGGLLGGQDSVITSFVFDNHHPVFERGIYQPDIAFLNQAIQDWTQRNISFMGIFHSHPADNPELSGADRLYIEKILQCMPEKNHLWFPVVLPQQRMAAYVAYRIGETSFISKDGIIQVEA